MKKNSIALGIVTAAMVALVGCNGFFDKDNTPTPTPLNNFVPQERLALLWSSNPTAGLNGDYLKLVPAITSHTIITASENGHVASVDKATGKLLWQVQASNSITAGPAADDEYVVLSSRAGIVSALNCKNGHLLWQYALPSETLSPPAVGFGMVIVKTISGEVVAINAATGHKAWTYQITEPNLILRGGSQPQITRHAVVLGFSNGKIVKLSLRQGSLLWQQTIAIPTGGFAIERMVDINANPVVQDEDIYSVTYQGKIAKLSLRTGHQDWARNLSSFTGMSINGQTVVVTDTNSLVWAFNATNGDVRWKQDLLKFRNITAPASLDNNIIVGDQEGYLHVISKADGHQVARVKVSRAGILSTPKVDNDVIYVLTKDGYLAAYRLSR